MGALLKGGSKEKGALRDVAVGRQDLVADHVGAGAELPEREHDPVRLLATLGHDRQRHRPPVARSERDTAQRLFELAVEAEVDARGRLGELRSGRGLGLEDDGVGHRGRRTAREERG